jgi:hypothetical protein
MDRRSQAFEDTRGFASGDPQRAFDYYLGGGGFKPVAGADVPYVREWGLELALEDLRRVVRKARDGGRPHGRARRPLARRLGGRRLRGLGLQGPARAPRPRRADAHRRRPARHVHHPQQRGVRRRLAELRQGRPVPRPLGIGVPWAVGVLHRDRRPGALAIPAGARRSPSRRCSPRWSKPPFAVTNEALVGRVFDRDTSPPGLDLVRVRAGRVAPAGDPRPWLDGEVTPVANVARFLARQPVNSIEWYFPRRLTLDVDGASA